MSYFIFCGLETPTLRSGETLKGVVVTLNNQSSFIPKPKALKLKISGVEILSWTEMMTKDLAGDVTRMSERKIFEVIMTLWDGNSTSEIQVPLAQGTQTYNFSFQLPHFLPASYNESHASRAQEDWILPSMTSLSVPLKIRQDTRVEYLVNAYFEWTDDGVRIPSFDSSRISDSEYIHGVEIQERLKKLSVTENFNVLENVSLHELEDGPISESGQKTFLFGGKKPLIMKAMVPRGIWFADENIPLVVEIRNLSNKKVDSISVILKRWISFQLSPQESSLTPKFYEREETIVVQKIPNTLVEPSESNNFDIVFQCPPYMKIGTSRLSKLIQVRYQLKIEANVSQAFNLDVYLPIHLLIRENKLSQLTQCIHVEQAKDIESVLASDSTQSQKSEGSIPPKLPQKDSFEAKQTDQTINSENNEDETQDVTVLEHTLLPVTNETTTEPNVSEFEQLNVGNDSDSKEKGEISYENVNI